MRLSIDRLKHSTSAVAGNTEPVIPRTRERSGNSKAEKNTMFHQQPSTRPNSPRRSPPALKNKPVGDRHSGVSQEEDLKLKVLLGALLQSEGRLKGPKPDPHWGCRELWGCLGRHGGWVRAKCPFALALQLNDTENESYPTPLPHLGNYSINSRMESSGAMKTI